MDRLSLFPITAIIEDDTLTIAGHSLAALADEFGTPLYVCFRVYLPWSFHVHPINHRTP